MTVVTADYETVGYCDGRGINCNLHPPDDRDVLRQMLDAAQEAKADRIVHLTGDCPWMDPDLIDATILTHDHMNRDLVYGYGPQGFEARVINTGALKYLHHKLLSLREHGTIGAYTPVGMTSIILPLVISEMKFNTESSHWLNYSVDTPEELEFARTIAAILPWDASMEDIIQCVADQNLAPQGARTSSRTWDPTTAGTLYLPNEASVTPRNQELTQ